MTSVCTTCWATSLNGAWIRRVKPVAITPSVVRPFLPSAPDVLHPIAKLDPPPKAHRKQDSVWPRSLSRANRCRLFRFSGGSLGDVLSGDLFD